MTRSVPKLAVVLLPGLLLPWNSLTAQGTGRTAPGKVELTALGGYQFGGGIGTGVGDLHLDGNPHYGGILGFRVRPDGLVELSYNYLGSTMSLVDRPLEPDTTLGEIGVHQIQIGGAVEKLGGPVLPFGMGHLGVTIFSPTGGAQDSETRFSAALGGGVKVPFSSGRMGLRLQGRVWFALFGSDGGFWCSLPGACAVTVTGTALVQGEVSAGLYLSP